MNPITDIIRLSLELYDRTKSIPMLNIDIHKAHFDSKYHYICMDLSVTNVSKSAFSIAPFLLNGKPSLDEWYIWVRENDRGIIKQFESEKRTPTRLLTDSLLLHKKPLVLSGRIDPDETPSGLVIWDWYEPMDSDFIISTIIPSTNREISAQIPNPNQ